MSEKIRALRKAGQSIWCDNISRGMIDSGELRRLIDDGVTGVTSNPTIFMKAIGGGADYNARFDALLSSGPETMELYEGLVLPDIVDAADALRAVYDDTGGIDGYISLEVNPKLAYDTEGTIAEARRLFAAVDRPNLLIKVPATSDGIPAIETLIADGISVNVTLIFSRATHGQVMRAYVAGLGRLAAAGGDVSKVASVASFFVSRVDTLVDALLEEKRGAGADVGHLLGRTAIANARLAYADFEAFFDSREDWPALAAKGARVQRPLWASTSTKNPDYSDTLYCDGLVGPHTVNTLPPDTIQCVVDHGTTRVAIRDELESARGLFTKLEALGIHIDAVTDKLSIDGVAAFAKSFDDLLANLAEKRQRIRAAG